MKLIISHNRINLITINNANFVPRVGEKIKYYKYKFKIISVEYNFQENGEIEVNIEVNLIL